MEKVTRIFLAMCMIFATTLAQAQINMPQPSPKAKLEQKVGLTDVTIEYARPSMRGRTIFGDLVPYGKIWRLGANAATKLTVSDEVEIAGNKLEAGSYALFAIPGENEWTIVVNKNWEQWGTGEYKEEEDVFRFTTEVKATSSLVETFEIGIGNLSHTKADLYIKWENAKVVIPMTVEVDSKVMADIKRNLRVDPRDYYMAATYYHESGKDLKQAHEWISKAIEVYEEDGANAFWVYRRKALIEADMGDKETAIVTAKKSMEKAKEAGNDDYVRMNEKSNEEWSK
jgi:tetratricopeptide (TPR) repeat protein